MVSVSAVHQELVKSLWVSDKEFLNPKCRSWFRRIAQAKIRGIAMVKNVQHIHAVLCLVKYRDSGKKYIGIGTATDITAIIEIVRGNPRLSGHLSWRLVVSLNKDFAITNQFKL